MGSFRWDPSRDLLRVFHLQFTFLRTHHQTKPTGVVALRGLQPVLDLPLSESEALQGAAGAATSGEEGVDATGAPRRSGQARHDANDTANDRLASLRGRVGWEIAGGPGWEMPEVLCF